MSHLSRRIETVAGFAFAYDPKHWLTFFLLYFVSYSLDGKNRPLQLVYDGCHQLEFSTLIHSCRWCRGASPQTNLPLWSSS